jgi:NhaA family Na+:H+ antiporter
MPLKPQDGKPAKQLEHVLHPWVAFMILPLFAFANAGVSLQGVTLDGLTSVLPLGIIAGLFIGKPLGISLFCWLALKLKLASLPKAPPLSRLWRSACCVGLALRCRSLSRRWPLARMPLS